MSSEYRTLTFHRSQAREESSSLTWIISNDTEMCYCIEARADSVMLHREGALADKLPVATLHGAEALTIVFGGEKPVPPHHLLVTHSRTLKVLYNGTAQYQWCAATDGQKSWYELLNPLDAVTPFARLRVSRESGAPGRMSLEMSVDIWLHSVMCDAIITAVVLMFKTNDPWLECAGIQLL